MGNKVKKYLNRSLILIAFTCIAIFISMGVYLAKETEDMANDVSDLYMTEINDQLHQKFDTIISLRTTQLEGLIERTPPSEETWNNDMKEELKLSADVRDFMGLGMYRYDGTVEMIYGEKIEIREQMIVNCQCEEKVHMIQLGFSETGEKVLVLGRTIAYPMSDGGKSDVLFAVLSLEYINESMYLDVPETQVTTHIIDRNGNYIIKNGDTGVHDNAYDRIISDFTGIEGKEPEDYVNEFKAALASDGNYSTRYLINGQYRRLQLTRLTEGLDWYAMTVIPDEEMNSLISGLFTTRNIVMFGEVIVIIIVMLFVFRGYHRLSAKQVEELEIAKQEANDANEAKSRFLTSMSHDIRTPMNAIIGMSDIAMKNIDDTRKATECLRKVQLSSKHLLGLINDILDMSSIESGKLTIENRVFSLNELMGECVDIIQPQIRAKKQNFDIFIGDIIAEQVYSDSVRMSQVLLNLLTNATKYTQEGGSIYLNIYQKESELGQEYVRTIFEVEDTGIGISEEFLEIIFDRFAREDNEQVKNINGSGLGMAITKSIIDLMEGDIKVESEIGKGSKFTVILDIKKAMLDEEHMKLPNWKVLIVDDNEQLCTSAASTCEELGLVTEWTQDGMEAIRMVEEHHKNNDDYHFVLMDWKMPNMDGIETIREMRKRIKAEIPIFLISAYSWMDVERVLQDTEIAGFISKPLFKSNLYTSLLQYEKHEVPENDTSEEMEGLEGKKLLLAEDNDINYEIVAEVLSVYGIEVDRAENGRDCVEIFEKTEEGYYDAVLMDVHMPIMDGYEATRRLRQLSRDDNNLPIIAMTADVFSDNIERCLESGMNECITKPLDVKECLRVLKKYI